MSGPLNADGHHWDIPLDQARARDNLTEATAAAEAARPPATQPDSDRQPETDGSRFDYPLPGPAGRLAD